jgi:hypothetical protein
MTLSFKRGGILISSIGLFETINNMNKNQMRYSFPLVAEGSCRSVYAVGNGLVAKKATNKDGFEQCNMENRVYRHADDYFRDIYARCYGMRPGWW